MPPARVQYRWGIGKVHKVGKHVGERQSTNDGSNELVELDVEAQRDVLSQAAGSATAPVVEPPQQATQDGQLNTLKGRQPQQRQR